MRSDGRGPAAGPAAVGGQRGVGAQRVEEGGRFACAQHGALVGGVGVGGDGGEGQRRSPRGRACRGQGEDLVEVGGVGGERVAERRAQRGHAAQVEQARVGQRRAEDGGQHLLLAFDAAAPGGGVALDG